MLLEVVVILRRYNVKCRHHWFTCLGSCLGMLAVLLPVARGADESAIRTAIAEASAFLIDQGQAADGGFSTQAGPADTALAASRASSQNVVVTTRS